MILNYLIYKRKKNGKQNLIPMIINVHLKLRNDLVDADNLKVVLKKVLKLILVIAKKLFDEGLKNIL